jgi:hypothetical protein
MTRRLLALAAVAAFAATGLVGAAPASACTMDGCPRGPFCPYVHQLCLNPF